jgi:DNA-binding MarR family transcriptional regulator
MAKTEAVLAEQWHALVEQHARVHLSQSALSRVVGRLEEQGLVCRNMCKDDRRGIFASLTPAGRERYEQARPTHSTVLAQNLR